MDNTYFLGALPDSRPEEEKAKDFSVVETTASAPVVNWVEKKDIDWRTFSIINQGMSGSCVAQTTRKLAEIQLYMKERTKVRFSAVPIYQNRSNKPGSGMIGVEAFEIWRKTGITLEDLVYSQDMTDEQMDAVKVEQYEKDIAKVFTISGHSGIPNGDFEQVASIIQNTGKGVMVWFYFSSREWSQKFPMVMDRLELYAPSTMHHSVAAIDFGLIDGKKYILIEDSAWFGKLSRRWISEEFFRARNWFARYATNFSFQDSSVPSSQETMPKPSHIFRAHLEFIPLNSEGRISDLVKNEAQKADVIALQNVLKFEGFFPIDQESTGYFGAMTAKGLYNWQKKHSVALLSELDAITPHGGRVGEKSVTSLNAIYA